MVTWADELTAWSTLAYTVATIGLFVAAVYAGVQVRAQLRNMRDQLNALQQQVEEARNTRHSSLRPIPTVSFQSLNPTTFVATIRNIGQGPFRNLVVRVRTEEFPAAMGHQAFDAYLATRLEQLRSLDFISIVAGGLGAHEYHATKFEVGPSTGQGRCFLAAFSYKDIFDRHFDEELVSYVSNVSVDAEPTTVIGTPL